MRAIDKILLESILPPFLIALVVLTFVVAVHELGSLSELLITRDASLGVILTSMGAILPRILIFSLPLSYLIGILIGLTGLSGESQITALRACGVPLRTLLRFILLLGGCVGILTGFFSLFVLPQSNDILERIKDQMSVTYARSRIQPRIFNEDFPNIVFYIDDLAADKQHWSKVFLADNSDPKAPRTIIAHSGTWIMDSSTRRLQLHLEKGTSYAVNPEDPSKDNVSVFASTDIPIDLNHGAMESSVEPNKRPRRVSEQRSWYLWRNYSKSPPAERLEQLVELNRRLALPFSIFPFAFLGLTLAVSTPKGGRTSGFALSLVTVIIFYMLFFNGLQLALVGKVSPWLGAWGADILMAVAGLLLLRKVEQSFALGQWISSILWKSGWGALSRRLHLEKARSRVGGLDGGSPASRGGLARYRFPKILDLYISRGFFVFFFWSLITCGTLFVLFTLFDLLDDIIRNRIPVSYVLDYFTFLTPQILMIVIPMSHCHSNVSDRIRILRQPVFGAGLCLAVCK
jgi:LPS export ABC transporter permease LptF